MLKIRINLYKADGSLLDAYEFAPGYTKSGKFDSNTQKVLERSITSVGDGGTMHVQEVK